MRVLPFGLLACAVCVGVAWAAMPALTVVPDIEARRKQFVTTTLTTDLTTLPESERRALEHLVAASKLVHEVFARQAWRGNPALAQRLASLTGPGADAARDYYRIMVKPWDALKHDEPFLGSARRPEGAGFYPEDITRAEFEKSLQSNPGQRAALVSPTTIVERRGKKLVAVPYGKAYADLLERAAAELKRAAAATTNASLKTFLEKRAAAFLSDNYFDSDMAWMDLDGAIEIVIGPYETYEDSLFGYKASFESFVCVAQPADSEKLAAYKKELPFLETNLPIPHEYKNAKRGAASPIRVADLVFSAGDARSGVQTLAFNLPNDERVREAKGSKKVLLKNMMRAKYDAILAPIAARVLTPQDAGKLDFDTYFHFILFHELSHGLGPGRIEVGGRQTEVRLELKDLYSAIEEAKADVVGVYNLYAAAERRVVPQAIVGPLPWTYVAGLFRTARFGVKEAHGLGVVLQTNYLLRAGAIAITPDGHFAPVPENFREGMTDLARDLLMIEAKGDYAAAQEFVKTYGTPPPEMSARIAELVSIPVDVDPYYALYEKR